MCGEVKLKQFNYGGRYGRCMQSCVESNDTSHSDRHFNKLQQGIVTYDEFRWWIQYFTYYDKVWNK